MVLAGMRVGFCVSGAHEQLEQAMRCVSRVVQAGAEVFPIVSDVVAQSTTRYGSGSSWLQRLKAISGRQAWVTLADVEPIGPQALLDILIVAPCTGNSFARIANAITDSPVTLAVKSQLRNDRPVVLAVSSNDMLGLNAKNLGTLLWARNIYFVPFYQDQPVKKPQGVVADWSLVVPTLVEGLAGRQLQPLLRGQPEEALEH